MRISEIRKRAYEIREELEVLGDAREQRLSARELRHRMRKLTRLHGELCELERMFNEKKVVKLMKKFTLNMRLS